MGLPRKVAPEHKKKVSLGEEEHQLKDKRISQGQHKRHSNNSNPKHRKSSKSHNQRKTSNTGHSEPHEHRNSNKVHKDKSKSVQPKILHNYHGNDHKNQTIPIKRDSGLEKGSSDEENTPTIISDQPNKSQTANNESTNNPTIDNEPKSDSEQSSSSVEDKNYEITPTIILDQPNNIQTVKNDSTKNPTIDNEPKSDSDEGSSLEGRINKKTKLDRHSAPLPYQPPYWEEKLAKNVELIMELTQNPELKAAFVGNFYLLEEFLKHPDISREIARDRHLARKVIENPEIIKELALNRAELQKKLKHDEKKLKHDEKILKRARRINERKNQLFDKNDMDEEDNKTTCSVSESVISESIISIISRATLPRILTIDSNEPQSIKYLMECDRLYLKHHVEITDGFSSCCDKKREYYDILNIYGRLMYRVYETRKRRWCTGVLREFKMIIKEPDGTPTVIMERCFDFRKMRKIAVYCPVGNYIGCVEENWGFFSPTIDLKNKEGDQMINIRVTRRPLMSWFRYHPEFEFELRTLGDHNNIGKISSEWLDLPPGVFPSEKLYGINFPKALSSSIKLLLMTAWFLVYLLYYDGKLTKQFRYNLSPDERAMAEFVHNDPNKDDVSDDPSSDSKNSDSGFEKG